MKFTVVCISLESVLFVVMTKAAPIVAKSVTTSAETILYASLPKIFKYLLFDDSSEIKIIPIKVIPRTT